MKLPSHLLLALITFTSVALCQDDEQESTSTSPSNQAAKDTTLAASPVSDSGPVVVATNVTRVPGNSTEEPIRDEVWSFPVQSDEIVIMFGSGIALFCVMYITLFIPIDKSGPRILCILVPMNTALIFSRRMQRLGPEYALDVNQPVDVYFFLIFWFGAMHFVEYLVAFTSIALITNEINRDQYYLAGFVKPDEAADADAKADVTEVSAMDENEGNESGPKEVVVLGKRSHEAAAKDFSKSKKEIRVPSSHFSGAATTIKLPSLEAPVNQKKFRTRSIRKSNGVEVTETDILTADDEDSRSTIDIRPSYETLPLHVDYLSRDAQDELVRRIRAAQSQSQGQTKRRKWAKGDDYPMISYVPADVAARRFFLLTFAFLLYIFFVVYVL